MTSFIIHDQAATARTATGFRLRVPSNYRVLCCAMTLLAADMTAAFLTTAPAAWWRTFIQETELSNGKAVQTVRSDDILILMIVLLLYLASKGRYSKRTPFWSESRRLVLGSLCAAGLELLVGVLVGDLSVRLLAIAVFLLLPGLATIANRMAKHMLLQAGAWTLPVVILGDGPGAIDAGAVLQSDRFLGYQIVGRVDAATILSTSAARRAPRASDPSHQRGSGLAEVLDRFGASRILIAVDSEGPLLRQLVQCALRERVPFAILPMLRALPTFACETSLFFSHEARMVAFRDNLSRPLPRIMKMAMDLCIAASMLVLASPLFVVIALANWRSGGPILFAQRRIGVGGRSFRCFKFRTMVVDADRVLREALAADPALASEWEACRKLEHDPRVTPLGRLLRRTSLDELPQLINVLRRDMSLVGPRPIVESEICLYGDDIAQYYATRPGLTGLWQVSGRSRTTYARRVQLDVWYVNNWTIWNDIAVLLKTIPVVLRCDGAC